MKYALTIALLLPALPAFAQHVHGEGRLDVVIERESLTLHLELPLDVAVGFERAPRNAAEKAALASAGRVLEAPPFAPSAAARCLLHSKQVSLPFADGKAPAGEHADIVASANPGCSLNLAAAGVPARHPMCIIDEALSTTTLR